MKTILAMGQSNAQGWTTGGTWNISPRVTVWNNEANTNSSTTGLGTAFVTPTFGQDPFREDRNNMFAHAASALADALGEDIRLILVAMGSQNLNQWTNGSGVRGDMYARMQAILGEAGVTSVDALMWHQGEADQTTPETYKARWALFLGNMETDGYINPATPIVMGTLASRFTTMNPVLSTMGDARTAIAFLSDLPTTDTTHFSGQSLVMAGRRYAGAISRLPGSFNGAVPVPLDTMQPVLLDPLANELKRSSFSSFRGSLIGEAEPFEPSVIGRTTEGTCSYLARDGLCQKIGNLVLFWIEVRFTGHTGTGGTRIMGLPYAPLAGAWPVNIHLVSTVFSGRVESYITAGAAIDTLDVPSGGSAANVLEIKPSMNLWFSGAYLAAP